MHYIYNALQIYFFFYSKAYDQIKHDRILIHFYKSTFLLGKVQ